MASGVRDPRINADFSENAGLVLQKKSAAEAGAIQQKAQRDAWDRARARRLWSVACS